MRKAEPLAGNRMTREAKAGMPKDDGKGITTTAASRPCDVEPTGYGQRRDAVQRCSAREGAHAGQVNLWRW